MEVSKNRKAKNDCKRRCNKTATSKLLKWHKFFIGKQKPTLDDYSKLERKKKIRVSVNRQFSATYFSKLAVMCAVWWCSNVDNCVPIVVTADQQRCSKPCSCYDAYKDILCQNLNLNSVPSNIPSTAVKLLFTGNNVRSLDRSAFKRLINLELLQLEQNRISNIPVTAFYGLRNLRRLDLSHNKLTKVPKQALGYLENLQTLILRKNPITSILAFDFIQVRSTLVTLDIGELRHLTHVSKEAFNGLFSLQRLNMDSCNLQSIPDLFPLKNLRDLDLSENRFTVIPSEAFSGLNTLERLMLQSSQITQVEDTAFANLYSLQALNLMRNNLTTLKVTVFDNSTNIHYLYLKHNSWLCNCNLMPLAGYLNDNNFCASDDDCPACQDPASARGLPVTMLLQDKTPPCAAFIIDPPQISLNVSAGNPIKLPCLTVGSKEGSNPLPNVRWHLPKGTQLTHGNYKVGIKILPNGSLNITRAEVLDKGTYTCSVTAPNQQTHNSTVILNVTPQSIGYYTTSVLTTITSSTTSRPWLSTQLRPNSPSSTTTRTKPQTTTSTTTTATTTRKTTSLLPRFTETPTTTTRQSTTTKRIIDQPINQPGITALQPLPSKPTSKSNTNQVLGATNVIIGCFVSLTLIAAILLIMFYKLRKRNYSGSKNSSSHSSDENDKSDYSNNQANNNDSAIENYAKHYDYNLASPEHRPSGSRSAMTQSVTGTWVAMLPEHGPGENFVRLPSSAVRVLPPTLEELRAENGRERQAPAFQNHEQQHDRKMWGQEPILGSIVTPNHTNKHQSATLPAQTHTTQMQVLGELHKSPEENPAHGLYSNSKMTVKRCKEKSAMKRRDPNNKTSFKDTANNTQSTQLRPKSCINLTQPTDADKIWPQAAKGNSNCSKMSKEEPTKSKSIRIKSLDGLLDHKETEI